MSDTSSLSPPLSPKKLSVPKVGVVSLGCPKALVDSERIMTQLRSEGYQFTGTHDDADVVIVNTCGFLDSAKEESLGAEPEQITAKYPNIMAVTGPHQSWKSP